VKNYKKARGLSHFLTEDLLNKEHIYNIQGPMGTGIDMHRKGRHIAFSGGTGVLVFIDMVAHLILRLLPSIGGPDIITEVMKNCEFLGKRILDTEYNPIKDGIDLENFVFELYTSFPNEEETIGFELINLLKDLCKRTGKENLFVHWNRLSSNKDDKFSKVRWDENFFIERFS
jgi:hypothetical protein